MHSFLNDVPLSPRYRKHLAIHPNVETIIPVQRTALAVYDHSWSAYRDLRLWDDVGVGVGVILVVRWSVFEELTGLTVFAVQLDGDIV